MTLFFLLLLPIACAFGTGFGVGWMSHKSRNLADQAAAIRFAACASGCRLFIEGVSLAEAIDWTTVYDDEDL